MAKLFLLLILTFASFTIQSKNENDFTAEFCPKSAMFVRLSDGTFPDCTMWGYVIEVDWARRTKIYEGIGQSLWYSQLSGKDPALVLLVVDVEECKKVAIAKHISDKIGIYLATYPIKCPNVEVIPKW